MPASVRDVLRSSATAAIDGASKRHKKNAPALGLIYRAKTMDGLEAAFTLLLEGPENSVSSIAAKHMQLLKEANITLKDQCDIGAMFALTESVTTLTEIIEALPEDEGVDLVVNGTGVYQSRSHFLDALKLARATTERMSKNIGAAKAAQYENIGRKQLEGIIFDNRGGELESYRVLREDLADIEQQLSGAKGNKKQFVELEERKASLFNGKARQTMDRLSASSPVTEEQAAEWAKGQTVTVSAKNRMKKLGYAIDRLYEDMAIYYRLTHGRMPHFSIVTKGDRRASASLVGREVRVGSSFSKRALFHEMSHLLECDNAVQWASYEHKNRRTEGEELEWLGKLTGNSSYRRGELARPDKFFHPYVGKEYADKGTEILSMGLQEFSQPLQFFSLRAPVLVLVTCPIRPNTPNTCLLYTSDAADE